METLATKPVLEQKITLIDRKSLSITGVQKMLSVKPELIQLSTNYGSMQVGGREMEMSKLDLEANLVEIKGIISEIKYLDDKKTPFLKRIFKWFIIVFLI